MTTVNLPTTQHEGGIIAAQSLASLNAATIPCGTSPDGPRFVGWHLDTLVDLDDEARVIPASTPREYPPLAWTAGRWRAPQMRCSLRVPSFPGVTMSVENGSPAALMLDHDQFPTRCHLPCRHLLMDAIEADLGCAVTIMPPLSDHHQWPMRPSRSPVRWAHALGRAALLAGAEDVVGFGRWQSGPPPFVAWTAGVNGMEIAVLTPMVSFV